MEPAMAEMRGQTVKCECSRSFTCELHRTLTPRERALAGPADHSKRKRAHSSVEIRHTEHPLDSVG
jgi:hypothetical protein